MRAISAILLLCGLIVCAVSAGAQTTPAPNPFLAACGDEKTSFDVSRGAVGDTARALEPGKAVVYIIEVFNIRDKGRFNRPTIKHGLDGAWIGATQGFTYVSAAIDPGEHHLCSRWQSHLNALSDQVSLYNFTAAENNRYYFRVQINIEGNTAGGAVSIDLEPVSEDEGRFLLSQAAQSVSKPKK